MPKGMLLNSPRHNRRVKETADLLKEIDKGLDRIDRMSKENAIQADRLLERLGIDPRDARASGQGG